MVFLILLFNQKAKSQIPLIMSTNLVEIFYIIDEFCKGIEKKMAGFIVYNLALNKPALNLAIMDLDAIKKNRLGRTHVKMESFCHIYRIY